MGNTLRRKLHIGNLRKIWSITWTAWFSCDQLKCFLKRPLKNADRTEDTTRPSFPASRFLGGWIIWIRCLLWQGNTVEVEDLKCVGSFFQLLISVKFLSPCLDYKLNSIKPGWIFNMFHAGKKTQEVLQISSPSLHSSQKAFYKCESRVSLQSYKGNL